MAILPNYLFNKLGDFLKQHNYFVCNTYCKTTH